MTSCACITNTCRVGFRRSIKGGICTSRSRQPSMFAEDTNTNPTRCAIPSPAGRFPAGLRAPERLSQQHFCHDEKPFQRHESKTNGCRCQRAIVVHNGSQPHQASLCTLVTAGPGINSIATARCAGLVPCTSGES